MKLIAILVGPYAALAVSWTNSGSKGSQLGLETCTSNAEKFITTPVKKSRAIERAMDHCALDKKVDDKNFVCPHYREILTAAFARESTTQTFNAKSFCEVTELYVSQLKDAADVPNMGKGAGFHFKLSEECKPTVAKSFEKGKKTLPAKSVPDFWYALCMNQDCAHFLPSRTRWCTHDHQPTHSQSVCEAVRVFARDEAFVMEKNLGKDLDSEQVCSIYDDFVEETHIDVSAYMHVVYGTKDHPVPSPENKMRALESAKMKNEAQGNKLKDGAGQPVKSGAAAMNLFLGLVSLAGLWA